MKIVEALKNLKTIQKRIDKNCADITKYCTYISGDTLPFESHEKTEAEVKSLIQANLDLETEYLKLKRGIELTNLNTEVTIGKFTYTLTELISIKRIVAQFRVKTYSALNPTGVYTRFQQMYSSKVDATNPPKLVPAYREEDKNNAIKEWQEFLDQIDGKLEVINAETELLTA